MAEKLNSIFLSYSDEDAFEAGLLQFALEALMADLGVKVWTYERDQNKAETDVLKNLRSNMKESKAMIFLLSQSTLNNGSSQWMELGYSDVLEIPTFILLHHLTPNDLAERGKSSLLLSRQLNEAKEWMTIGQELRKIIGGDNE